MRKDSNELKMAKADGLLLAQAIIEKYKVMVKTNAPKFATKESIVELLSTISLEVIDETRKIYSENKESKT